MSIISETSRSKGTIFILLWIGIFLIYSNSFDASWHFDDIQNIVENPRIHVEILSWDEIQQTFYASYDEGKYLGKNIYRPIACFTFGINWFFSKQNVASYHLVNVILHFLTSFLLYLTIFRLLMIHSKKVGKNHFAAGLSTVLWAMHPIHVQAVTYIVQRMALLAALFYLAGILLYLRSQTTSSTKLKIILYSGIATCFLLAVGSKENAVMMPVSLFMIHALFFQKHNFFRKKTMIIILISLVCMLATALVLVILRRDTGFILKGYETRSFSLLQRFLTEPRILLFHLSQLIYPLASRFSIAHDISASLSPVSPWQTLPSIILVSTLLTIGLLVSRKQPILSFAILFFFVNHIVESSILPLELMFEHRNYLPSLFLFVPVSLWIYKTISHYNIHNKKMSIFVILFVIMFIINIGFATFLRNIDWKTEKSLWKDAMNKAPSWARPFQNYSNFIYDPKDIRSHQEVFLLNKKALDLKSSNSDSIVISYINMGHAKTNLKEYNQALIYLKKAVQLKPGDDKVKYYLARTYALKGDYKTALRYMEKMISDNLDYLAFKSFLLLKNKKYDDAILFSKVAMKREPDRMDVLLNLATAYKMKKEFQKAKTYYLKAHSHFKTSMLPLFHLIEISYYMNEDKRAVEYAVQLIDASALEQVEKMLKSIKNEENLMHPLSLEIVIKNLIKASTIKLKQF